MLDNILMTCSITKTDLMDFLGEPDTIRRKLSYDVTITFNNVRNEYHDLVYLHDYDKHHGKSSFGIFPNEHHCVKDAVTKI